MTDSKRDSKPDLKPDLVDDPEEFVTVEEFIEPIDAQMAKGALESAGIESFLVGENTNNLLGAAFWAQLQVHKKDEAAALEILGAPGAELNASERANGEG
jgi:hypothetical protein